MKCPFGLPKECPFFRSTEEMLHNLDKVKLLCGLCMKAMYAHAHNKDYKLVNTL